MKCPQSKTPNQRNDDVCTVIIEGRVIMRDRRLLTLNEGAIKADARRYRDKVARSVGMKTLPEE